MLAITTDGRKAALDMRLIFPNMKPAQHTKASVAAQRIAEIWRQSTDERGAQLCSAIWPRRVPTHSTSMPATREHLLTYGTSAKRNRIHSRTTIPTARNASFTAT